MSEVETLLEADSKNSIMCRSLFNDFDPNLNNSFDEIANIFQSFSRSFGKNAKDDKDSKRMEEIAIEEGLSDSELLDMLKKSGPKHNNTPAELFNAICGYYSRRSRGLLFLQAYRSYMYAATDLRRLRVTSAVGHLRVEIESIALMEQILSNVELAYEWLHIQNDEQGRSFFNKTKKKTTQFCQRYDLSAEWNLASQASQHARFVGLIDGFSSSTHSQHNRIINQYELSFQDFDSDRPDEFVIRALYILRTQGKLLLPIELSLPEAIDPLLKETRIPNFHRKLKRLYELFRRKFPKFEGILHG